MQSDAANVNSQAPPHGEAAQSEFESTGSSSGHTSGRRKGPWLPAIGLLILLTGLGLGWRWWQGRAAAPGGPMAAAQEPPPGLPVQLETLEPTTLLNYTEFIGSLDAPDSLEIQPEITGRVSQIYVSKGDRVAAGTPLVQLRPDQREADLASVLASVSVARSAQANALAQVEAARADRIAQQSEVELQQRNFERTSTLVERGALSEQALDEVRRDRDTAIAQLAAIDRRIQAAEAGLAEAQAGVAQSQANADRANAQLQETIIVAPFDGIVGDIPVRVGAVVTSSDVLTSLTRNQSLNLRVSVPLERAPDVRVGQRVQLIDNQGNVLQTGAVSFISPRVEGSVQSVLAEATFENPNGQLLDGQFVRARLIWDQRPGLLVPASAITRLAGEPFVFVAQPPDPNAPPPQSPQGGQAPAGPPPALIAQQRPVQLGSLQGNDYQVLEGLAAGEQVVISGVLNLSDGAPIMPVSPGAEAGPGAPMMP